jgi:hypothetical protein
MKFNAIMVVLLIVGALYYWTDGDLMLGLNGPQELPDSINAPNSTFLGDEQSNPYFANQG